MEIRICKDQVALGESAAKYVASRLNEIIEKKGYARIVLSTGASQFDTLAALTRENVNWSVVDMFHLDEYVNLPITHGASFRKYLQERFVDKLPMPLRSVNFVDGTPECIENLTKKLREDVIDIGLIGIGENTHIAFNDPPANFDTKEAYIIVNLDDNCKRQQMGEGWFPTIDDVPKQAVSMTTYQIMQCEEIVSCVPYAVKANAIEKTLKTKETTPLVPATLLKEHKNFILYADADSAKNVISFEF
ncbi:MAG: 6-phosphogluconolactonase [Clostridia bacterium]|jgi:glucosamine-6-phosphate deaminase|nr:6-phosphogluconolactonase [Clostridia bacterium]MBQ5801171.1 6-phosphogluconolactonase [Clostridia bacterium]